ncbi:MAG: Coenzyme F420 hydrogenase/dehydrogenase, beta subunit C-terminal domain [Synergistaceae bacterium]|jgi:coenzyme F420-reducing hydrogenase beta subunit|nr:Coenzyme F420 hydrogenase/dehydrogenase, beta subunit C-terminal domain [Synergistaceae bacterium]
MIYPTDTVKCTGCRCCAQTCPCRAISVIDDEEGFPAPKIDEGLCTNCGLCKERCPENNNPAVNAPVKVFGARYKLDDKKLYESASGGVFLALAEKFLVEGKALVFGAALDKNNVCRHIGIRDIAGITPLQSSKYVQSDTLDTFDETKQALDHGLKVLYSGTPCQIAGLHAYFGKDYDNLYTVDVICHGVPSPALFEKYIQMLEEQEEDGKIIYFNFRSKYRTGWNVRGYMTKTKYIPLYRNAHLISFLRKNLYMHNGAIFLLKISI